MLEVKTDWAPSFIKLVQHTIPTPDPETSYIPETLLIKQLPKSSSKGIIYKSIQCCF